MTKKFECLPSLDQDDSKEEELQFSLNKGSDGKANEEDDNNTVMEMASNEQTFEVAELLNGWFKGHFVSNNVFNLSRCKLSKAEVSLLSKSLKFCPTPNTIDKPILKEDLAEEQLSCKEMYEEVTDDPSPIIETMDRTLEKIRKRGGIDSNTLKYFDVDDPSSAGFISCLKYIKACIVFQEGPSSLTLAFIQKIFLHF